MDHKTKRLLDEARKLTNSPGSSYWAHRDFVKDLADRLELFERKLREQFEFHKGWKDWFANCGHSKPCKEWCEDCFLAYLEENS